MNPKTENNPYLGFVYTSFQERATKVSHGNTARFALEEGDPVLAKICGSIAADEGRHEIAYTRIVDQLWEVRPPPPNSSMLVLLRDAIRSGTAWSMPLSRDVSGHGELM